MVIEDSNPGSLPLQARLPPPSPQWSEEMNYEKFFPISLPPKGLEVVPQFPKYQLQNKMAKLRFAS